MRIHWRLAMLMAAIVAAASIAAVKPTPQESAALRRWVAAKFQGVAPKPDDKPGIYVLANYGPVDKDGRAQRPLVLAGKEYRRGLYCHAPSKLAVRLPGPGKSFSAVVGIDANADTVPGRGSVVFAVAADGKELFRSPVMREGMPPAAINVNLAGANELVLQASDAGDGISCDQADWADAKITLADGRELWLGALEVIGGCDWRRYSLEPPFSFQLGGKPSSELLQSWTVSRTSTSRDALRTEHTVQYTDPASGVSVRAVAVEYHDFPAVEWTLYFKNTANAPSPILEQINAVDVGLDRGAAGEFVLHHHVGSPANGNDYGPQQTPLGPTAVKRIGAAGGRPTNTDWSYFNLAWPDEGLIVVVGWPGQWTAEFARDSATAIRIRAGQEFVRLRLEPGEEIRTPLIVLQPWHGDRLRVQNLWRRWMMAHSMPKPGGKLPKPQLVASSSRQFDEMIKANEQNQIAFIDRYREERIQLDYWWMDAGWYVNQTGWPNVGTWEVDAKRFPRGLRAVSDHAHRHGMKTLVWFEPERVTAGTWLAKSHPEWIIGGAGGGLLNLGDERARKWLTDHVDKLLTDQGIDLYRQDFNMDPLAFWHKHDAADRAGITEIRHVSGYLAYWDELRRRHPNLLVDACASGGRRNDLESMRRAVPLWRSDYAYEATGHQCMTYGISLWLPYHGTGTVGTRHASYYGSGFTPIEPYAFWSNAAPSLGFGIDMRVKEIDYARLRRLVEQWRRISPNYYGDFYPLTPWSRDDSAWMAWQFDRPEANEGVVQVFRRPDSFYETARLKLHGLAAAGRYRFTDLGTSKTSEAAGRELMETGLPVTIAEQPGVVVLLYEKQAER